MKFYQSIIHKNYHDGHIETDQHVISLIPEYTAKNFLLPNFTTPVSGTLREVLDNSNKTIDKISLNGLGMTNGESGGVYTMLKTVLEVSQDYTVFNYITPRPQKYLKSQDRTIVTGPGLMPAPKSVNPWNIKEKLSAQLETLCRGSSNLEY